MKNWLNFIALVSLATFMISCGSGTSKEDREATTYTLKWKDADWMEYGPSYLFEDQQGKEFRFNALVTPDFQMDNNPYFTVNYKGANPEFKLKDNIKDKWFKVTIKKQVNNIEGIGKDGKVEVIVGIDPVE